MYLARLSDGVATLVQGAVRLTYPAAPASRDAGYLPSDYWQDSLRALARGAVSTAPRTLSLRMRLSREGALDARLFVLGEAEHASALRRWLAGYTRLGRVVADSVFLPLVREDFDALGALSDAPNEEISVARVSAPDYRRQDLWVACDVRLLPVLGDMLLEARQLGFPLIAQINLAPFAAADEQVREARRNARLLGETGRAPAALLDLQQRVARRLAAAAYLIEEYVGTTPGPAETWLRRALGSRFRQQFHELRMDEPLLDFAPAEGLTGFDPPIHSSLVSDDAAGRGGEDASVAELCATAEDAGVVERALSWMPPESLRYAAPEEPPNEDMVAPVRFPPDVPPATRDAAGYVFISYAHADAARIAPHMRTLHESGVTYWYDAGIPSGAEWDAVIESRIERCRALLLFLSARSAASKYVRREVKFADALDKPLMSLVLEPVALSEGLRMLLTQYQMIDAGGGASREGAGLAAALRGAIGLDKRPSQPRS